MTGSAEPPPGDALSGGSSIRGGAGVAIALLVTNLATYGFTIACARLLGPHEYGAVAALLATLLIVGVVMLGLQATAARRVAANPEHRAEIEHEIVRVGWWTAIGLGLLLLVASPLVERLLRLDSLLTAVYLAIASVPLTLLGAQIGVLQGERRWKALSWVYLALGIPRLVLGVALIAWHPDQRAAMLGIAISAFFPAVVGWFAVRRGSERFAPEDHPADERHHPTRDILREAALSSQALLAVFALSNADVIVARHALDQHLAGIYAGGLILTKAMLFLPQFVTIVAFPDLSTESSRRRALLGSLGLVAALGVAGVAGAFVLRGLALVFIGGSAYDEITGELWKFALLGTLLSMLQLLVYAVLARSGRRPVLLVWAAFVVVVALGSTTSSVAGLLALVIGCDSVLLVALLVTDVRRLPAASSAAAVPPPSL